MHRLTQLTVCLLSVSIGLTACSPFSPSDRRAAVCNELNSKLIFNGGTSNLRKAEIQSSEDALLQRQYDNSNCDK